MPPSTQLLYDLEGWIFNISPFRAEIHGRGAGKDMVYLDLCRFSGFKSLPVI